MTTGRCLLRRYRRAAQGTGSCNLTGRFDFDLLVCLDLISLLDFLESIDDNGGHQRKKFLTIMAHDTYVARITRLNFIVQSCNFFC